MPHVQICLGIWCLHFLPHGLSPQFCHALTHQFFRPTILAPGHPIWVLLPQTRRMWTGVVASLQDGPQ